MGTIKTAAFTTGQNQLANMLKALGHPARIAILQHIIKAKACICGELTVDLGLAQATVSQHLKVLKNAGLIQGTITGVSICYCIEPQAWAHLEKQLGSFMASYQKINTCC